MIIKRVKKGGSYQEVKQPSENQSAVKSQSDESKALIKERQERRRGDRRRGYRRIDDRSLISRAHEEALSIKERASKEGFEYGISQAKEEITKLNHSIADFLRAKEKALEEVSGEIAFLAVKVAEKIIKTEVACDETIVLNIVSETLKNVGKGESNIIIRVNPQDVRIVKENIPKVFVYGSASTKINIIDDSDVENGS